MSLGTRFGIALVAAMLLVGAVFMLTSLDRSGDGQMMAPARVWHGDHWDYPGQQH